MKRAIGGKTQPLPFIWVVGGREEKCTGKWVKGGETQQLYLVRVVGREGGDRTVQGKGHREWIHNHSTLFSLNGGKEATG